MKTAIEIENLGKKYIISHQGQAQQYVALRDVISDSVKKLVKPKKSMKPQREDFWALRNLSLQIDVGEKLGVIGRNGAGKTTLLKILSRITSPSEGKIKLNGRVSSLLEVGTGFHPELTGRENIYLNGAILGLSRKEIRKKFAEIIEFAEIEKFLDTPVKRYSSGMYVRLAFAVDPHLEPEILLIDEVLAVGDIQFQKKCLDKMGDISREGRTVLFVSHNLTAIEHFCSRCILLQSGNLILDGNVESVIEGYIKDVREGTKDLILADRIDRTGSGKIRAVDFKILDSFHNEVITMKSGEDYYFEIDYLNNSEDNFKNIVVSLDIFDDKNSGLLLFRTNFTNNNLEIKKRTGKIFCKVNNLPLAPGNYHFSIFISSADIEILDYITDICHCVVEGGDFFGTGSSGLPTHCKILHKAEWFTE